MTLYCLQPCLSPSEFPQTVMELKDPPKAGAEEPEAVYYPGTEIEGYMPRRSDFAHVRVREMWADERSGLGQGMYAAGSHISRNLRTMLSRSLLTCTLMVMKMNWL